MSKKIKAESFHHECIMEALEQLSEKDPSKILKFRDIVSKTIDVLREKEIPVVEGVEVKIKKGVYQLRDNGLIGHVRFGHYCWNLSPAKNDSEEEEKGQSPPGKHNPPHPSHFEPDENKKLAHENKSSLDPNRKSRSSDIESLTSVSGGELEHARKIFHGTKSLEKSGKKVTLPGIRKVLGNKRKWDYSSDSNIVIKKLRLEYSSDDEEL